MKLTTILSVVMLAATSQAHAQGAKVSSPIELSHRADDLKPGEWVWAPEIAPEGPLLIYVDLSRQIATVYRNGVRIGVTTVSSGKAGHETPTGVFTILQKDANHHSNKYDNAPMPFQERLTWDGIALHAGGLPGYPESHGCIHLPYSFAKTLFSTTTLGATVIVAGNAQYPVASADGGVLAPQSLTVTDRDAYWAPEKSPAGPVTIVFSRQDQTATVLRNGIEIGRTRVVIPADSDATHVLTLGEDGKTWIYVGIAGHNDMAGKPLPDDIRDQVQIPPDFYAEVSAILLPGATILVTQASVTPVTTGEKLTVLNGDSDPATAASQ